MAKIANIKDNGEVVYPITKPECVIDEDGKNIKEIVANEWKCVYDGRMSIEKNSMDFTAYDNGTPLKAKEAIIQVLIDSGSKNNNGYIYVNSTSNKTMNAYGIIDFERATTSDVQYLNQAYFKASPMFMVADLIKSMPNTIATGEQVKGVMGGSSPQIYEDITYIRLVANSNIDVPPLIKIYAR